MEGKDNKKGRYKKWRTKDIIDKSSQKVQ